MGIKRTIASFLGKALIITTRGFGRQFFSYTVDRFMDDPKIIRWIETKYGKIGFWSPNEITNWRAQTLLTKEPETIEWIDSFEKGDTYWDIGANIGVYALYAAKKNKINVLAFEASPFNYYALTRNVFLNNLTDSLSAYCLAFNDVNKLEFLNMSSTKIGGALSNFGETTDYWGKKSTPDFRQAMIGMSIDEFIQIFSPAFPNHIKIDVDGIEAKIVHGARKTLTDERLKTLLIELDETRGHEIAEVSKYLHECGLKLFQKRHSEMIKNSEFSSSYNFIFNRY